MLTCFLCLCVCVCPSEARWGGGGRPGRDQLSAEHPLWEGGTRRWVTCAGGKRSQTLYLKFVSVEYLCDYFNWFWCHKFLFLAIALGQIRGVGGAAWTAVCHTVYGSYIYEECLHICLFTLHCSALYRFKRSAMLHSWPHLNQKFCYYITDWGTACFQRIVQLKLI